ncbi:MULTISPECIES: hypothetical protein [Mycobacterium]|uniref:Uncharacterized protein n=1 Tax=Mycobacterium persicum TaxID=1487726 RepID=A0AB38UZW4_9MYCO|nr:MULTISPECIES: hypothetical protein [Mycobacterium]ARG57299.1 hypothetical protein B1T43_17105 [Mycobacterium kansasii]ORB89731.1 hypothetical protein B1T49_11415 [Mycobacterium persicum]VAZ86117.1 hypothetical protein LAUMK42_04960 [Mycobacterium persicum]
MSAVAVLLIAVGIADGWRRLSRAVWLPLVTGPAVVVACAALCGLWHARDIVPLGLAALAAVAWEVSCLRSERTGKHQRRALAVMVVGLAVLTTLSGLGSHAGGVAARWAQWVALPLGTVTPTRLLMVVGVVLLQRVEPLHRPQPGCRAPPDVEGRTGGAGERDSVDRQISVGSTVSVCTVIPAGGRRLSCANSAGARGSTYLAPSKSAAELPATTPRRRDHNHAARARWLAISSAPDGT